MDAQEGTSTGNDSDHSTLKLKPLQSCTRKEKYSFICECFFMTARVLNLGLMKAISDFKHLVQVCLKTLSFFIFGTFPQNPETFFSIHG